MRWPWQRSEARASSHTDALVSAILQAATGTATADAHRHAALETAAVFYQSAFAAARVDADARITAALTPSVLALIVRNLIRHGESLHVIDVTDAGQLALVPVGSHDVRGPAREADWWYRADVWGPSGSHTRTVPSAGVLHFRYAVTRRGRGAAWRRSRGPHIPAGWPGTSKRGSVTKRARASAASSACRRMTATPTNQTPIRMPSSGPTFAARTASIYSSRRRRPGTVRAWAVRRAMTGSRIGSARNPPATLDALRSNVGAACLTACGVPLSLAMADRDGTAAREGWRRFVLSSCVGLAAILADELRAKLDPVSFSSTHCMHTILSDARKRSAGS